MSTKKHVFVLANSIKHYPAVCVAGREIISGSGEYSIGPWIRPISTAGEGELQPREIADKSGRPPQVLNFVEVPLSRPAKDLLQPENWFIEPGEEWKSINSIYQKPTFDLLVERPVDLWLQPREETDRISDSFLQRNPPSQSLYFIHVPQLTLRMEWTEYDGNFKQRRRAIFTYNKVEYDMSITDPVFNDRHYRQFPAKGQPAKIIAVRPNGGCYLCVSLAPVFRQYHFKVVATVLEA